MKQMLQFAMIVPVFILWAYYRNRAADDIRVLNNLMLIFSPRSRPLYNPLRPNFAPNY